MNKKHFQNLDFNVVQLINLSYKPFSIIILTATGVSEDAVQGLTHQNFLLHPYNHQPVTCCTPMNNFDMILGAELLFNAPQKVHCMYLESDTKRLLIL